MDIPAGRHPDTAHLAQLFGFEHLPDDVKAISRECHDLARVMIWSTPDGPELTFGLRQLLLAKDAFVRANVLARTT